MQGSWNPAQLYKTKNRETPTQFHTCGQLRLSSSLRCIYMGCKRKQKNLQRTWNGVEESYSLPSSPFGAARCFDVVNSGSNPELSSIKISLGYDKLGHLTDILIRYLVHLIWIRFTTKASGSNLASILSLAPKLNTAAHQRNFNSSICNCDFAGAFLEWRTMVWKNLMQMVNKNAWAQTLRHKKCWQINLGSHFQG